MNPTSPQPSLWDAPPGPDAGTIAGRFERFHAAHPEVYAELAKLARQVRARGHHKYSIKGLFEIVRFNAAVGRVEGDIADPFVLNNDFSALYARLLMEQEADLAGMFETRHRRAD